MSFIKITLLLALASFGVYDTQATVSIPPGALKGDFDGDGKPDYIYIKKPQISADGTTCVGPCFIQLVSSNKNTRPVKVNNSIGGMLTNLGDLNGDGKDDIGLLPEWFTSCWRNYYTFTLEHNQWHYLVPPFSTYCNQWEAGIKPLEKVPGKPGYLKESYSAFVSDSIVVKSKLVKFTR